jgi:hypothetical protein
MRLGPIAPDGTLCADGVLFQLADINKTILVTSQTLHEAEDKPFIPFDELIRFRAHRPKFERIARIKHASGKLESDGSIHIRNGDLGLST